MPNLVSLIDLAQSLRSERIHVVEQRCSAVRHRKASCRLCLSACITDAISLVHNKLSIDQDACVSCGACVTVCPTEALVPLEPSDAKLYECAVSAMKACDGTLVISCARIAARREGDPTKFVEVPCLARIDESIVIQLVSEGSHDVILVDGNCATCKYHKTAQVIEDSVDAANELLEALGSTTRVMRTSTYPDCVLIHDAARLYGASRRGFFGKAGGAAKHAAGQTVKHVLANGVPDAVTGVRDLLKVTDEGTLPQFEPVRHIALLDAMAELNEQCSGELFTRRFGKVEIDRSTCTSCAMCTVFCPTHALVKSSDEPSEQGGVVLEFSAMLCVQCGLCSDVCLPQCLEVSPSVPAADLFNFEPRIFDLPRPVRGKSRFACR